MARTLFLITAFLLSTNILLARDEYSIKALGKALAGLGPDVDPREAQLVSETAHTTARKLAREYRVVLNPEFTVFLVNIGLRKRGWCGHWAQDIGERLKELKPRTLVLHWGVAYENTSSENNCIVVTARNQPFENGIILDGWRRAGRLFWCPVKKDDEYEVEQHFGHSGITAWRENLRWSAWLQDYETAKSAAKPIKNERNTASKASPARRERAGSGGSQQKVAP
ncbi:MAG: hypothetical protein IRY93_03015 [Chthoniobacterales bacterium]|nr:hypothetical protein [Chthoniobacterales bacterium]